MSKHFQMNIQPDGNLKKLDGNLAGIGDIAKMEQICFNKGNFNLI